MLSPDLQRVEHIRDYCLEIQKTMERYGQDYTVFAKDMDYQRSLSFCLLQIGELVAGLSGEYKNNTIKLMPWNAIKGMRNLIAHSYGSMSREIIWNTALHDIPALKNFCDKELNGWP